MSQLHTLAGLWRDWGWLSSHLGATSTTSVPQRISKVWKAWKAAAAHEWGLDPFSLNAPVPQLLADRSSSQASYPKPSQSCLSFSKRSEPTWWQIHLSSPPPALKVLQVIRKSNRVGQGFCIKVPHWIAVWPRKSLLSLSGQSVKWRSWDRSLHVIFEEEDDSDDREQWFLCPTPDPYYLSLAPPPLSLHCHTGLKAGLPGPVFSHFNTSRSHLPHWSFWSHTVLLLRCLKPQ